MLRIVFRAALPWMIASAVVGMHFEPELAPPSSDQMLLDEQAPPPRRDPKSEPDTSRGAPVLPV